jgi:hypothetical protein
LLDVDGRFFELLLCRFLELEAIDGRPAAGLLSLVAIDQDESLFSNDAGGFVGDLDFDNFARSKAGADRGLNEIAFASRISRLPGVLG